MKRITPLVLLALLLSVPLALAQGWQVYRYPEMGFSAAFPGEPKVSDQPYKLADGTALSAKLYGLSQGGTDYHVWVVDFTGAKLQNQAAIDQAVKTLSATGKVAFDIAARVNQNYGRQLSVTDADGSHTVAAIFFVGGKLYQIEGIVHEGGSSGDAVRFQQSMDFGGGYGAGRGGGRGRGGLGGGGRFGGRRAPPPPPDDPT